MSNLFQFFGSGVFAVPAGNDPYTWGSAGNVSNAVPSSLNDGSYLVATSSAITLYNAAGSAVWTKTPTNINASGNSFCTNLWVDTTDSPANVYVVAVNSGVTTAYPAKIAISTGTVTTIGTGFSCPTTVTGFTTMFRAAQGSGDMKLFYQGASSAATCRTLSFSTSTGAITVADAAVTSNGTPVENTSTNNVICYQSADGTILVQSVITIGSDLYALVLTRNGKSCVIIPGGGALGGFNMQFNGNTNNGNFGFAVVGSTVVQVAITASNNWARMFPVMSRATFDAWLGTAASYMGI